MACDIGDRETIVWYAGRTDYAFAFVFANVSVEQESPPTFYFIRRKDVDSGNLLEPCSAGDKFLDQYLMGSTFNLMLVTLNLWTLCLWSWVWLLHHASMHS